MTIHKFSSRRKFIKKFAATSILGTSILKSKFSFSFPSENLSHACIGVGGMGWHDLHEFISHPKVNIVAICDVDSNNLQKAKELLPNARVYRDWRELLEKEDKNIDSVNVTVPDHSHFSIAYSAIQMGKHVYCQKPLCHDLAEVRLLTESSVEKGVTTQLGTQTAATRAEQQAVYLIKNEVIGKVEHIYLCSNRPGAIETYRLKGPRPKHGEEIPDYLDWDLWIGSAPMRPYYPDIYHPTRWRAWQDFGTGWSGDIGCHIFDAVWKGLNLKAPLNVEAEVQYSWKNSKSRRKDTWPQSDHITWVFPGNEKTRTNRLPIEWYDGNFYPPENIMKLYKGDYPPESAMLIGTKGALLYPHGKTPILLPEHKFTMDNLPDFEDGNHYHHFVDACLGGRKAASDFSISGPMTETVLLGTVAIREPDRKLKWDVADLRFLNNSNANSLLKRKYREGWHIADF